jgi:FAD synthase
MTVNQAKTVNAEKANTLGTVKVSMGRDFRFGTRSAEAVAA